MNKQKDIKVSGNKEMDANELGKQIKNYIDKLILSPDPMFLNVPAAVKLSILCRTPAQFVKARPVGKDKDGNTVVAPYIPIDYYERALNIVSNFKRGYKVIEKGLEVHKLRDGKLMYEAYVQLECWLMLDDFKIEKSPLGAVKMYENPATTKFDPYKAAISNGIKIFAKQMGIGADKVLEYKNSLSNVRTGLLKEEWQDVTMDTLTENMTLPADEDQEEMLS